MSAYSKALAWESIPPQMDEKYDEATQSFHLITFQDLERFARIVAYKVAHNDPSSATACKRHPERKETDQ